MIARLSAFFALLAFGLTFAGAAHAQSWPAKSVRVIVPWPPGQATDIAARLVGQKLQESLGQPFVMDNKPGAGGTIGTAQVAKAAPDGYTLLLASLAQLTINPALYDKMPYDTVKDVVPVTQAVFTPNILAVNNDVPAKTVAELVALARAQPGKLTFGSAGVGTSQHLAGELFKKMAGVNLLHVPYRGGAPAIQDIVAGNCDIMFGNMPEFLGQIGGKNLIPIAFGSPRQSPMFPDLPLISQFLPG